MARFKMRLAKPKPNTGYSELSLHPSTGDFSDLRLVPLVISLAVGESLNYGNLFAYLFRRFGFPNAGHDNYKQLCKYRLTTPIPGMLLQVTPYAAGTSSISFHFFVSNGVSKKLDDYQHRDRNAWKQRMMDWVEANNLLPEWISKYALDCSKRYGEEITWRQAFSTMGYFTLCDDDDPQKYVGDWYSDIVNRYKDIELEPSINYQKSQDFREWPDEDPAKAYFQAAYETLLDLKRPVSVRDININAFGKVEYKDLRKLPKTTDSAKSAGYPGGALSNEAPKEFAELHELINRLGKGNAKKGIHTVLELLEPMVKGGK